MTHKSGFVNILGNPNVGKSTLMNELVGERMSIITAKRRCPTPILGIVNGENFQIVFSDTPDCDLFTNFMIHDAIGKDRFY
jgi:GTP-binding protein Era